MNNLRQINLGVRMYADDSSDAFPPPPPGHNGPPDAFTAYTKRMRSYLGMTGASSERAALFDCPADTFYYDYNDRVSEDLHLQSHYNYSSYAFNGGNFPMGQPPVPRWPGIAARKLSSIKEPVKTVLVSEFAALGPWSWHQPAGATGHYNNAQNMVSYVDGHVRFIKMYWEMPDITPSEYRSQANGIINFMGGVGSIIAFLIGSMLYKANQAYPFWLGSVLVLLAAILVFILIKEPKDYAVREEQPGMLKSLSEVINDTEKSALLILLAIFSWFVAYNAVEAFFTLFSQNHLGMEEADGARQVRPAISQDLVVGDMDEVVLVVVEGAR